MPLPIHPSWWYWHLKSVGPVILIYKARSQYSDICKMFHSDIGRFCKQYFSFPFTKVQDDDFTIQYQRVLSTWNTEEGPHIPIYAEFDFCMVFRKANKDTMYNWLYKMLHWSFSSDRMWSFLRWYAIIVKIQVLVVRYIKWANTALYTISEAHLKHKCLGSSYPWWSSAYITQFRGYCNILWLLIDPWSQHTIKKNDWIPHSFIEIEVPYPALHITKVFLQNWGS